jgi:hypothetical protein
LNDTQEEVENEEIKAESFIDMVLFVHPEIQESQLITSKINKKKSKLCIFSQNCRTPKQRDIGGFLKEPGMVVHVCNSRHSGARARSITIGGKPRQKEEVLF